MRVTPESCTDLAEGAARCRECLEICPERAIVLDGTVQVSDACSRCGICYTCCANGVFAPPARDDDELIAECLEGARSPTETGIEDDSDPGAGCRSGAPGVSIVCSCRSGDGDDAVVVPCLSRLTETILLAVASRGVRVVELRAGRCEGCRYHDSLSLLERTLVSARVICGKLGLDLRIEQRQAMPEGIEAAGPGTDTECSEARASRRRAFTVMGRRLFEGIWRFVGPADQLRRPGNDPRRKLLVREIRRALQWGAGRTAREDAPAQGRGHGLLFARASVNGSRCDGCGVCAELCPVDALRRDTTGGRFRLLFSAVRCTSCGACTRACEAGALDLTPETDWAFALRDEWRSVLELGEVACPRCGLRHVDRHDPLCVSCRKRGGWPVMLLPRGPTAGV